MKFFSSALLLAMSSSAHGSSKSAKSRLTNEPGVISEENAFSISLSSYPESVVVVDAEIAAKSTKKRLFAAKSSKSNRR